VKIAVLGSSGGSAFAAFHDVLSAARPGEDTFVVAVDRDCGLQTVSAARQVECVRIDTSESDVSATAAEAFALDGPPDAVLLFYNRLVTPALYDRFPTFNVHPSLLPAFAGFRALERALDAKVRFFGATLHRVDESVDLGPIVAQVVEPLPAGATLAVLEHRSFLHKVWCALALVDTVPEPALLTLGGSPVWTNPGLAGQLADAMTTFDP
jgi:phosphoribosylglycinamide formyltransferase-1